MTPPAVPPRPAGNCTILLAEDNPGDVFLVRRALDVYHVECDLRIAKDGEEAMDLVLRADRGEFNIDLILLDLNLPRYDGSEIVAAARSGARLKNTPIILLTSSDSPHDRVRITELGADVYFRKPSDLHSFMKIGELVQTVLTGQKGYSSAP